MSLLTPPESERRTSDARESWEIEILISGGAFVFLYQLSEYIYSLTIRYVEATEFGFSIRLLLNFIVGGLRILAVYFVVHLAVRAFWLCLVLLRKAYPGGINTSRLNFREPYRRLSAAFNIDSRIGRMDALSGLTFSWAVLFFVTFIGLGIALTVGAAPFFYLAFKNPSLNNVAAFNLLRQLVVSTWLVFVIDTILLGPLRRIRAVSTIYYPIYIFWNTVSLGFIWRPGLQTIFSNARSKVKAVGFAIVATLVVMILSGDEDDLVSMLSSRKQFSEKTVVESMRYLDKRKPGEVGGSAIQSDVITDGYLKVFVNYNSTDDRKMGEDSSKTKQFSQMIRISINDSICQSPQWVGFNTSSTEKGIQTVLDIRHLKNRMHILQIERSYDKRKLEIPFWKQ